MRPIEQWLSEAEATWATMAPRIAQDAYAYPPDEDLDRLCALALSLGLAATPNAAHSVIGHHLSPVVGWALHKASRGRGFAYHEADWRRRARLAAADFEEAATGTDARGGEDGRGPHTQNMKQPEHWIADADAAWNQVNTLLHEDLHSYPAFEAVLTQLDQRAVDYGLAPSAAMAARDVHHNLDPAIGLARLVAHNGEDLNPVADSWKTRVRQAVTDMEER